MRQPASERAAKRGNGPWWYRASAAPAIVLGAWVLLLAAGASGTDLEADPVARTRTALEKWVETRRLISREKCQWQRGRELLNERIELLRREIESIRENERKAQESIAEAEQKQSELSGERDRLKGAAVLLAETAAALEQRAHRLLGRLPEPIQERVKPLSVRIPQDPEKTKLSLGQRFQNVVGVLNELSKFNREITLTSEIRTLSEGASVEVTAVYLGLGQGYYLGSNGKAAGIGTAGAEGWTWRTADEQAAAIAQTIAILKNDSPAAFVTTPVEIK